MPTTSNSDEWYTPGFYVGRARQVMTSIDLDPASSDEAQEIVRATRYFTVKDNGLNQEWHGNVWLNPPYSAPGMFIKKLLDEIGKKNVEQAVVLVNDCTDTGWWHDLAERCAALCIVRGRIRFWRADGRKSTTARQGQTFFYFGDRETKFQSEFRDIGLTFERSRTW